MAGVMTVRVRDQLKLDMMGESVATEPYCQKVRSLTGVKEMQTELLRLLGSLLTPHTSTTKHSLVIFGLR